MSVEMVRSVFRAHLSLSLNLQLKLFCYIMNLIQLLIGTTVKFFYEYKPFQKVTSESPKYRSHIVQLESSQTSASTPIHP